MTQCALQYDGVWMVMIKHCMSHSNDLLNGVTGG